MSGPSAKAATLVAVVVSNLLPILAVVEGAASAGDVFALYWLENVVVGVFTVVKVLTAEGIPKSQVRTSGPAFDMHSSQVALAGFFCLHYGIFTFVHGIFTVVIIVTSGGFSAGAGYWLVTITAMVASYLISLGVEWFGRDQKLTVSPAAAMIAPYPRMLVLHVGLIVGFMFVVEKQAGDALWSVVILFGLKTLADSMLALIGPWPRSQPAAAT